MSTRPSFFQNGVVTFPKNGNLTIGRSFSTSLGVSGTADGTRAETITFSYAFQQLLAEFRNVRSCSENEKGVFIESDLKIREFIFNKMFIASVPGTTLPKDQKSPFTVFTEQITFVASYGGNVTPTWKFTRISADPNSPLFIASRQKTQDLTITLGDLIAKPNGKTPAVLTPAAQEQHLAALIGQAVANAIQSQQR